MGISEMSNLFDLLYNNITSNQAPGLNEWEKSVFLTKAQDEIIKNHFNPKSNKLQEGYDDSPKRQIDFSMLTTAVFYNTVKWGIQGAVIDSRSRNFDFPEDVCFVLNETLEFRRYSNSGTALENPARRMLQVVPISFTDYTRLMQKPYKYPLKNQAWRLINHWKDSDFDVLKAEIIMTPDADAEFYNNIQKLDPKDDDPTAEFTGSYTVRYVKYPYPIILADFSGAEYDNLKIRGKNEPLDATNDKVCELDPAIHEEIVQRAVELAKIAWTATGNDNVQAVVQAGERSE